MSRLLTGDVGLFFVFVDDSGAAPWQSEDREAVEGKIREARRWLEVQASVLFVVRRRGCPSRAFPFADQVDPEFACERAVIFDAGRDGQIYLESLIAHEILHLYGADDLHTTEHESDLMHTPTQRPIDDYLASDLTASLVGWRGVACTMHVA